MKKSKAILLALCAVLLVAASVMGTLAYLTSTDTVVNTFTVGKVAIKLDEAKVNVEGKKLNTDGGVYEEGKGQTLAPRVDNNTYKLLPGHEYAKDPTVTVLKDSESSYIKMTVTFTKSAELDAIFDPDGATLINIFKNYDAATWLYQGNTEDATNNTRTYEFWYKETVAAPTADVVLAPLFDKIVVPGNITNDQLDTITGMTITVNAYAIQADGFNDAADAWAHW